MRRTVLGFILGGACGLLGLAGQTAPKPPPDSAQLALILRSARAYCGKLERAALDFICLEEVEEKLDLSRDDQEALERAASRVADHEPGTLTARARMEIRRSPKQENSYLYDYQFVRREGKIEEKRVLLKRNGRKTNLPAPNTRFSNFSYSDVLLAPIQLLDEEFEAFYAYKLLGRGVVSGMDAWILEVAPRVAGDARRYLGGRLWLKADDASVLKIEWDPATFGHYERIQARAEAYEAAPEVRSYSEFGVEKNGLRFPSVDFTEEAYRSANGKLFVRARTSVTYRDHKFFTVETSSTLKK
jgi:hypothetical protein